MNVGSTPNAARATLWRWRFSLRTLLAIVTLACVLLGAFYARVLKQARCVKALQEHGATVDFVNPAGFLSWPQKLAAQVFGKEGVYDVVRIGFGSRFELDPDLRQKRLAAPMRDSDLRLLGNLRRPRILVLENTQVTKDGLKNLETLDSLQVLDLDQTSISDDAVDQLVRLRQLKLLSVISTELTDEGTRRLRARMPWCKIQTADVENVEPFSRFPPVGYDQTLLADPIINSQ